MTKVSAVAEAQNHHPRWLNDWNEVEIWLSTHSAGKITDRDHKLAKAIDIAYVKTKRPSEVGLVAAKLYTDGGSRSNPGQSAGAYIICTMDNSVVKKSGFYLGLKTNNQAEYQALLKGLQRSVELEIRKLNVFMDSELIVKQLKGLYKVKNKDLKPLYLQVKELINGFEEISFAHIPRLMNIEADREVNRILDKHSRK